MKDTEIIKKCEEVLKEILDHLNLDTKMKVSMEIDEEDEKYLRANIEGDDLGNLIGYRGNNLNALQIILSRILVSELDEPIKILVDINNYREKRKEYLISLARKAMQEAVESGQDVGLQPLSAFERRIIHMALKDDNKVTTESEGEGEDRHVIVKINKKIEDKE